MKNEVERIAGLDTSEIEKALRALVTQMVRIDRSRQADHAPLELINPTLFEVKPLGATRLIAVNRVVKDPVRGACKNAIRLLGMYLFESTGGDIEAMRKIAERVARAKDFSVRMNIIDKAWDGIGTSKDNAGWLA